LLYGCNIQRHIFNNLNDTPFNRVNNNTSDISTSTKTRLNQNTKRKSICTKPLYRPRFISPPLTFPQHIPSSEHHHFHKRVNFRSNYPAQHSHSHRDNKDAVPTLPVPSQPYFPHSYPDPALENQEDKDTTPYCLGLEVGPNILLAAEIGIGKESRLERGSVGSVGCRDCVSSKRSGGFGFGCCFGRF